MSSNCLRQIGTIGDVHLRTLGLTAAGTMCHIDLAIGHYPMYTFIIMNHNYDSVGLLNIKHVIL